MSDHSGARLAAVAGRCDVPPTPIVRLLRSNWFRRFVLALLTLPYWLSGLTKLANFPGALAEANQFGLQPAPLAVTATIAVQLVGSAMLILGRRAWLAAGALGVFTMVATLIAHPFWMLADSIERFHQTNTFVEHLALIGGLALAAILADAGR